MAPPSPNETGRSSKGSGVQRAATPENSHPDHGRDGSGLEQHEHALHIAARTHSKAVDRRQAQQGRGRDRPVPGGETGDLAIVVAEGHRHCRHPAGLSHQKKDPAINEGDGRMVGFTQVKVLPSRARQA